MKKRLLFVSYTADWTGPNNSLWLLLEHLRSQYELTVLAPGLGSFSEALVDKRIPFVSFPSLDKCAIPSLAHLIRREKYDLIYGNGRNGASRNALIASKLARVPFICHIREMEWGDSWRISGFLRFADGVIFVSQACAKANSKFVPQDRSNVIYNGVELATNGLMHYPSVRTSLLSEIGLSDQDVILCNVGRIIPAKGQEYVIEGMAEVVRAVHHARLLLIGSFDRGSEEKIYAQKVRAMIKNMSLEQQVFLLGYRQDARQLMAGSDLFLYASLRDAHPRSVIEAMSVGLPVVAFAVDGVAETVVDGQTGYLVQPGDVAGLAGATLKLVQNPELRSRMGMAGQQRVQTHFSAETTAQQVGAVIERVLAQRGR
ncbi:MAG: glycosyltransferase family 4 protein [Anaerolineales bacterium]|nr:glycosyltransferase family 4 protein [Anaerolineales bacterium]